jgi:hypothetical protein
MIRPSIRYAVALALVVCGCSSGSTPSQGASASASHTAEAPAPLDLQPESFVRGPGLGVWLVVSDTALYYSERVDEAERIDRIMRVPLAAAPTTREEVIKGKLLSWTGSGEHLLVSAYDADAKLVDGKTKVLHDVGPVADSAWGNDSVYVARDATDKTEIVIDTIALGVSPPAPKRLGTIPRTEKMGPRPSSMVVSSTHLFVAVEDEEPAARAPGHIYSLPLDGGEVKKVGTVVNVHQLVVVAGELYVGSLAKAHKLDASGTLKDLGSTHWDQLTTDGKTAHYVVATSLPGGGIGGYLYAWAPPAEPIKIYDKLRDPNFVAMNGSHVYWIGRDGEIFRAKR